MLVKIVMGPVIYNCKKKDTMKALAQLPNPVKSTLKVILFPLVFVWVALGVGIMSLGDGLHWLGNKMTGDHADRSIGTVEIQ